MFNEVKYLELKVEQYKAHGLNVAADQLKMKMEEKCGSVEKYYLSRIAAGKDLDIKAKLDSGADGEDAGRTVDDAYNPAPNLLPDGGKTAVVLNQSQDVGLTLSSKVNTIFTNNLNQNDRVVISDVRHHANNFTTGFANSAPEGAGSAADMTLLFDPQALRAKGVTTGSLFLELIDIKGAFKDGEMLQSNTYDTVKFMYNGQEVVLKIQDKDGQPISGKSTYDDLLAAIKAGIAKQNLPLEASFGEDFTRIDPKGVYSGKVTGKQIVIKAASGELKVPAGDAWSATKGVPADSTLDTRMSQEASTGCPLIESNVILDNVGRVNWDLCDRLPVYGANGGTLTIGSLADRGGVEKFNVKLERSSWLRSLTSTNDTLKEIVVTKTKGVLDTNGKEVPQHLYIGTDRVADRAGLDYTDVSAYIGNNGMSRLSLVPSLLEGDGLVNVRDFDASDMDGNVNLHAVINNDAFVKYFSNRDVTRGSESGPRMENGGTGIDFDQNPFKGGSDSVHNPVFDYKTGSGNDGVNMEVSGYIAADRDFKMNIDTGEGNDRVQFQFNDYGLPSYWVFNQQALGKDANGLSNPLHRNVEINTGAGNDIVELPGQGAVEVDLGAGNDVIYSDNSGRGSVFFLHHEAKSAALPAPDGVIPQADVRAGVPQEHKVTTDSGSRVFVEISFLGHTVTKSVNFDKYEKGQATISANTLNQLVIDAIEEDQTMRHLLDARDGLGQSLVVESLVDGNIGFGGSGLRLNFSYGTEGSKTNWADVDGYYNAGDYASVKSGAAVEDSNNHNGCDNVINPGSGEDLIVLSTDEQSDETIVMNGEANDTLRVVNFGFGGSNDRFVDTKGNALVIGGAVAGGKPGEVWLNHAGTSDHYDKVVLLSNAGGGGFVPPAPGGNVTVDAAGALDVSAQDMTVTYKYGAAEYAHTLNGFGLGDKIVLPANNGITVTNTDGADGVLEIQIDNGNPAEIITITLTGVPAELDNQVWGEDDFRSVFGADSLTVA